MKHYTTKKRTIVDALDDIESFLDQLEEVKNEVEHVEWLYEIKINPIKRGEYRWELELKLTKNERGAN